MALAVGRYHHCLLEVGSQLELIRCKSCVQDMPAKYIYEPWKAPKKVQEEANCIIGVDYPAPIVDHAVVSKQCIARMKEAYDAEKAGQNPSASPPKRKATGGEKPLTKMLKPK